MASKCQCAPGASISGAGAGISFADRDAIGAIVKKTKQQGGGLRTLIHEIVGSSIFQSK